MIRVSLIKRESGLMPVEVGSIQCLGVKVTHADGSTKIPRDAQGRLVPFSFKCSPANVVSAESAKSIAESLSQNICIGRVGDLEWRA